MPKKSEVCDLCKQVCAFIKSAQVVYIFPTALSCLFRFSFFFFEVHKSTVPYDFFKYPLNRDTYSFHRFDKALLFL